MNLGDGLLFELENGKPRLILLSHGVEKNPNKLLRPRVTNVLSSRQPSCLEEVQGEERPARQQAGRYREARSKAPGAATSLNSHTSTTRERSTTLITSKTQEHLNQGGIKAATKVKSDRHKQLSTVASPRANGKTGKPQKTEARAGGKAGPKDAPASGDAGLRDNMVVLTREQLQQLLDTIKSQQPPEDHRTQGSPSGTSVNEGEMMEEDRGGGGVVKKGEGGGGVTDATGTSQDKDNRTSACFLSWMGERQSDSRSVIGAKKAQWRRELDEQVILNAQQQQQRWAPGRIQAEEDAERGLSVQSSISHREQPAAIRSSLKLGEVTPMAPVLSGGRREEERRQWLEELNRQREEATERKRREKLIQNQTEDHELWAIHFDSLQQRPPVHTAAPSAPPPAPSRGSERGDWEPTSSLSLVWEATSSCGAESVAGARVDTTNGYQSRASHVRTMTALLDPAQIEERERRRFKQLEQQRAIEAQMEEQRQQREREEARRREEEETEARRLLLEREKLQRQYELDRLRERQKVQEKSSHQTEQPKKGHREERSQEMLQSSVTTQAEHLEEDVSSSVPPFKDTAVQTEAVPDVSAHYLPPPFVSAAPPPNSKNPGVRTGKENICLPGGGAGGGGGGDPYETFARTERSRTDKRRPDWNTQRPSRRFVPASERYPAALQRDRQESRLKRQAELVALQGRTCLSRTEPAPPPPPPHQDPRPLSNTQTRSVPHSKVGGPIISAASSSERGRSPPVPAVRHRVQSQQASKPLPHPTLDFIPYIRTDEITLDPLEPPEIPPPHTVSPQSSVSPPAPPHQDHAHTTRQQEILKSLAQLRQGLLQKQRELESDLNPLLKHHNNELRSHSAMHHK
ncbi:coiled-coil domain-containing protein 66 isoform X2 [Pleuronectes platessa]|uniref:coiled-coil domain-containing protein 66 isoform X2 n=1 Tax=Pleuronectes platessa TaxID=8262 RepID=UPI00232A2B53|nr:coiled-coil domain-containing protein 66 isoform X2 [Pleuronectes platessa]